MNVLNHIHEYKARVGEASRRTTKGMVRETSLPGNLIPRHLVAGNVEMVAELSTEKGHRRNDCQCDERDEQAVFDECLTFFFCEKT